MKKAAIVFIVIILILVGLYFIGNIYAVKFIRENLHKKLGPGFTIENLELGITQITGINATYVDSATNLKLFHVDEMRFYPSLSSFLKKKIGISRIEVNKPDIYVYRTLQGKIIGPWAPMVREKPAKKVPPSKLVIVIKKIQINDGTLNFSDAKITSPPARIDLIDVAARLSNLQFPPVSSKSPIDFKAVLRNGGKILLNGLLDFKTKNTDMSIKVNQADLKTFNPYIESKAPITVESGTVNLTSRALVKDEKLDMPGTLELMDLHTVSNKKAGSEFLNKELNSLLNQNRQKLTIEFNVKGDLSNPGFNFAEAFIGGIAKSIEDTLGTHLKEHGKGAIENAKKKGKKAEKSIEKYLKKKAKRLK